MIILLILSLKIVTCINFNDLDLEEYTYPEYPIEYIKDDMYYTLVNISTSSFNFSSLTFSFYEDSECFISADYEDDDGDLNSDFCLPIGQCKLVDEENTMGKSYQIWAMSYNEEGSSALLWIDYFDFFGKCDYNFDDYLSVIVDGQTLNRSGGYLESYDTIQLGSCTKSKNLFQIDGEPLYFRVYYGCEDDGSFENFIQEQKNSLIIGGLTIGGIIASALLVVIFFSCSQLFFLSVVDCIFMTQKLERKFKEKKRRKSLKLEGKEVDESTNEEPKTSLSEKIKNLTVYKAFFTSEDLGVDFEKVLPNNTPFLIKVWNLIVDTIMSLAILVILEVTRAFSLWFSIICFLKSDVSKTTPFYIQDNTIYANYQNILLAVFFVYVIVEVIFLIFWLRHHITNPAKVIIIYPCYQEWLVYRVFMVIVYFFYIFYGVQAFFATNEDYNNEYIGILKNIFSEGNFWSDIFFYIDLATSGDFWTVLFFYLKFASSTILLLLDLVKVLFYDGMSSINFYHRIQACSVGCGFFPFVKDYFPSVGYNLAWLGISPDTLLHRLITILSLLEEIDTCKIEEIDDAKEILIRKEIMTLSKSMDYGNLPWVMVKKMKGRELKLLKSYVFCIGGENNKQIEKDEEQFWDLLMYTPPVKPYWWKAVFFHACIQYKTIRKSQRTIFSETNHIVKLIKEKENNRKIRNEIKKFIASNGQLETEFMKLENDALKDLFFKLKDLQKKKNENEVSIEMEEITNKTNISTTKPTKSREDEVIFVNY